MNPTSNGGPAFPYGSLDQGVFSGMSLRDWFAGQSEISWEMAVIVADQRLPRDRVGPLPRKEIMKAWAELRYEIADAMLKAREEGR